MKAILRTPPDEAAIARLSKSPFYNARMRTTCVATRLEAGHANNALPGFARAIVNCRILPGHTADEVRAQLIKVLAEPEISVAPVNTSGPGPRANPPSPLRPDVMGPLEKVVKQMWPGVPVVPVMDAGASDGVFSRAAGIPTYGVPGVFIDVNDDRSHGRDERLPVKSFYEGVDFYYRFTKALTSSP
jgi:acetylornithine deacetylase/succinyl-diaminopimelate desuccinylase-like protein